MLGGNMQPRFEHFFRERKYLHNVTPATLEVREQSQVAAVSSPTQDDLKNTVIRMREKGLKVTGCNCTVRAINAYLHWSCAPEVKCSPACSHLRIPTLKEPE